MPDIMLDPDHTPPDSFFTFTRLLGYLFGLFLTGTAFVDGVRLGAEGEALASAAAFLAIAVLAVLDFGYGLFST